MVDFERFVEVISKKEDKRVVNITARPIVTDCEGDIWFTDLMLQEGDMLSGYTPHTKGLLKESENDPVWFNGIVRSEETVILLKWITLWMSTLVGLIILSSSFWSLSC